MPYIDNGPVPTPLLNGFEGFVCMRLVDPDIINSPILLLELKLLTFLTGLSSLFLIISQ